MNNCVNARNIFIEKENDFLLLSYTSYLHPAFPKDKDSSNNRNIKFYSTVALQVIKRTTLPFISSPPINLFKINQELDLRYGLVGK